MTVSDGVGDGDGAGDGEGLGDGEGVGDAVGGADAEGAGDVEAARFWVEAPPPQETSPNVARKTDVNAPTARNQRGKGGLQTKVA